MPESATTRGRACLKKPHRSGTGKKPDVACLEKKECDGRLQGKRKGYGFFWGKVLSNNN
jgi:hypothetical protein